MRRLSALIAAATALLEPLADASVALASGPDAVEMTLEGLKDGAKLTGFVYRPEGKGPFPAIVAMHSCDGLGGTDSPVAARYADWGERLAAAGFVVLFPDSFASRGLPSQCAVGQRSQRSGRERVGDADAARHWLQTQDYVLADRISLLGWANGAVAALWTVRPHALKKEPKPDFRSAVALYPGCRRLRDTAWSARAPTLILIGAKDDWAPASACEQMVAGARGRPARPAIGVYPGAFHGFDHPRLPFQARTRVAVTAGRSPPRHVGTHAAARAD